MNCAIHAYLSVVPLSSGIRKTDDPTAGHVRKHLRHPRSAGEHEAIRVECASVGKADDR
jgi:hypothetical protein